MPVVQRPLTAITITGRSLAPAVAPYVRAAVIITACAVSTLWALTVPMLQSPDENLHLDYVFALVHNGGLLSVRDRPIEVDSHLHPATDPLLLYVVRRTGFDSVIFKSDVRAPQDYGTQRYFASLDQFAPVARPGTLSPWLLPYYPFLYYASVAVVVSLTGLALPGTTAAIFAARLFSTLLLVVSLVFTDRLCRLRGLGTYRSILVLLVVGLAPLTSFVSSYVQPDNLSLCLVTGGLLFLHRWRASRTTSDLVVAGGCLGLLLVTKYQFFGCLAIAALSLVAVTSANTRWSLRIRDAALLLLPSLVTGAINFWVLAGAKTPLIPTSQPSTLHGSFAALTAHFHAGPWSLLVHIGMALRAAFVDYFLGGVSFRSYWGMFGWTDTPILIIDPSITSMVLGALEMATVLVATLFVLRLFQRTRQSIGALHRGNRREALQLALGDPTAVTYGAFVGFMFLLYVAIGDTFYAQGRNWFAVMPAAVILTVSVAPRAIPWPRWQTALSNTLLGGLVTYALVGSLFAYTTMHQRYYGVGRALEPVSLAGLPLTNGDGDYELLRFALPDTVNPVPASQAVPAGGTISVAGWAYDRQASAPARAVFISVDDSFVIQAYYGDPTTDLASPAAPSYSRAGFDAIIGTEGLQPGAHRLRVMVVSADGRRVYTSEKRFAFEVGSP